MQQWYTISTFGILTANRCQYFSIRVFCTENFKIGNIPHHYPYEFKLTGEWTPQLAGGCPNYRSGISALLLSFSLFAEFQHIF